VIVSIAVMPVYEVMLVVSAGEIPMPLF